MRYPTPALWRINVVDVHDGDTVTARVDRGTDDTSLWHIRLKDVFAPELTDVGGPQCRDYVLGWVHDRGDGSDWPLMLQTFRTPRSDVEVTTFSRYVGVITAADGTSLNADVQGFIHASGYGGGIGG